MTIRKILGICVAAVLNLSGCIEGGESAHPIEAALVGRTVTWDIPAALVERQAAKGRTAKAETQTWRADGTTTMMWRPLLVHDKTYPKTGRWRIEGRNVYCQTFKVSPTTDDDWSCRRFRLSDGGTRLHLELMDRGLIIEFRSDWSGTLSPA